MTTMMIDPITELEEGRVDQDQVLLGFGYTGEPIHATVRIRKIVHCSQGLIIAQKLGNTQYVWDVQQAELACYQNGQKVVDMAQEQIIRDLAQVKEHIMFSPLRDGLGESYYAVATINDQSHIGQLLWASITKRTTMYF